MASLRTRAEAVLAGGPATYSKSFTRYPEGIAPTAILGGEGAYTTGDNGQTYLDTVASLGTNLLGHGHPGITKAIRDHLYCGTSFSMMHPLEVEVAEQLVDILPNVDMVRFMRNGSDATNAAVRLARAYTGKRHVICVGYHGANNDWYAITTAQNAGVLPVNAPYSHQIPFGNTAALHDACATATNDLAAIILEVPLFLWPSDRYAVTNSAYMLTEYQATARNHQAVFILDEVVTMYRYGLGGAQALYSLHADLVTGGKALANGLPLAVLGGKRTLMEELNKSNHLFCSYTFGGETTALAAASAVLNVIRNTQALAYLHTHGMRYAWKLADLLAQYQLPARLWGNAARLQVRWLDQDGLPSPETLRTLWLAEHAKRGILMGIGAIFPMTCWTENEVTTLLTVAEEVCVVMREALGNEAMPFDTYLECPVIGDVLSGRAT